MATRQGRDPAGDASAARRADRRARTARPIATVLAPVIETIFPDGLPVQLVLWDFSAIGPSDGAGVVMVRSRDALTRILFAPHELGLARAFVTGELDVDGDIFKVLESLRRASARTGLSPRAIVALLATSATLGAIRRPPPRPAEEARLRGWRHTMRRDADAVAHHYDVGNEFYRLVLGASMTYSCARFEADGATLEDAQRAKHDLVCRKLGLADRPGMRLLDVGCGWGSMAIHAASRYQASVVAVTLSEAQARAAAERVASAGLEALVTVRLADYRDLTGERFDAISSVGMFEHVGAARAPQYFSTLRALLDPKGRLLNHAISVPGGSKMHGRTFINRYVFPDGELLDVAAVVLLMQRAGFEVRDVESLREHYAETLHAWVGNLERRWDEAVGLVGERRARVWRLYMAASANGFEAGRLSIHQVLGVVDAVDGASGMPRTRDAWVPTAHTSDSIRAREPRHSAQRDQSRR